MISINDAEGELRDGTLSVEETDAEEEGEERGREEEEEEVSQDGLDVSCWCTVEKDILDHYHDYDYEQFIVLDLG